jgi:hypothetical protein
MISKMKYLNLDEGAIKSEKCAAIPTACELCYVPSLKKRFKYDMGRK